MFVYSSTGKIRYTNTRITIEDANSEHPCMLIYALLLNQHEFRSYHLVCVLKN